MKKLYFVILGLAMAPVVALAHSGHGMDAGGLHNFFHASEKLGMGLLVLLVVASLIYLFKKN